jgi:hypothetical protein
VKTEVVGWQYVVSVRIVEKQKPPEEWVSGSDPMTGAQASYLTTLCEEAKRAPPGGDPTKAEASKLIDDLKAELGR